MNMWEESMTTSKVDERYRIVIDRKSRKRLAVRPGDTVVLEPLNERSFRVTLMRFDKETLEQDPAWKAVSTPAKVERYIPPGELEELMEEEAWRG